MKVLKPVAVAVAIMALVAGCASTTAGSTTSPATPTESLKLECFADVTHAPAPVRLEKGFFAKDAGKPLPDAVIVRALKCTHFSVDLRLLNDALRAYGASTVSSDGLGKQWP